MAENFSDKGYYILKNGISSRTVKQFQQNIINFIYNKNLSLNHNKNYDLFVKKQKI